MALGPTLTGHMYSDVRYSLTIGFVGAICFCSSNVDWSSYFASLGIVDPGHAPQCGGVSDHCGDHRPR